MSKYTLEIVDPTGQRLADLSGRADKRRFIVSRNEAEDISWRLPLDEFENWCRDTNQDPRLVLKKCSSEIRLKRGSKYLLGGQLVYKSTHIDANERYVDVRAEGFLNLLADRYTVAERVFIATERTTIAATLINESQHGDDSNAVSNPSFETDLTGWTSYNAAVLARQTGIGVDGASGNGSALSFPFTAGNGVLWANPITLSAEFTIYAKISCSNLAATPRFIGGGTTNNKIGHQGNGKFFVRVLGGGNSDLSSASFPQDNDWHDVILTRDGSNKCDIGYDFGAPTRLFSDAAQSGDSVWQYIGCNNDGSEPWSGKISSVVIWNRKLTAGELAAVYSGAFPANGMVGEWQMNEGAGITVADTSGNSNTGNITGATWTTGNLPAMSALRAYTAGGGGVQVTVSGLTVGTPYVASMYVRGIGGEALAIASDASGDAPDTVSLTTDFVLVTHDFIASGVSHTLIISSDTSNATFYLDNVAVAIDPANWDYGITIGPVQATVGTGDRTYQRTNLKDAIQAFGDLKLGGFDHQFTYDKQFNTYTTLGSNRPDVVFQYPGNIKSLDLPDDGTGLANEVTALGSGIGSDAVVSVVASDLPSQTDFKLRQKIVQSNGTDNTDGGVTDEANAQLTAWSQGVEVPILIVDGNKGPAVGDYWVGDYVQVNLSGYKSLEHINGMFRIEKLDVTIDKDDNEEVRVYVS